MSKCGSIEENNGNSEAILAISFRKTSSMLLFMLCAFPYISLVNTPFDTQPYAILYTSLLFIVIFLFQKDLRIPKLIIPYILVCAYSIIYLTISPISSSSLRSLVGYFSVPIFALAGYHTFKLLSPKIYMFVVWIWFIFGLLQTSINKQIGSFLLPRLSTSEDRGVTSLAPEPSYYAVTCVYLLIINDIYKSKSVYSKRVYQLFFVILVLQMLLAKGGLSIVFLFIYLLAKAVSKPSPRKILGQLFIFVASFSILILAFTSLPSLQNTRAGSLISRAIENPLLLLYQDGSMADRAAHILISFQSVFYNYGLGYGLGNWNEYSFSLSQAMGGITSDLAMIRISLSDRVMSGWGAALFELGIFGALFLLTFLYTMRRGYKVVDRSVKPVFVIGAITIFLVMMNAVPLSYPLFGYVVGIFIHLQYERKANTT